MKKKGILLSIFLGLAAGGILLWAFLTGCLTCGGSGIVALVILGVSLVILLISALLGGGRQPKKV